jgi:putative pyoverdin transport system ATP-binding/permease protein
MKLLSFLLRTSPSVAILIIAAGLLAGACNTGLLALIGSALNSAGATKVSFLRNFASLSLLMLVSRVASEVLLIRLSQSSIFNLRMQLSRQILNTPLRHLEKLGAHRLLATLADDIPNISNALTTIPLVCMNIGLVIGCLIYLGWLSWAGLLIVLLFMALGITTYQIPLIKASHYLRLGRGESDGLYQHFRALTQGTKELKLHGRRREAFLSQALEPTAGSLRHYMIAGNSIFAAASSWGHLLIFALIGLLLFVMPSLKESNLSTLTGYTVAILYMMTPLEVILNAFPAFGRANIAMGKIEELGLSLAADSTTTGMIPEPTPDCAWHQLELVQVRHGYEGDEEGRFVFGPVDLNLYPGELVFLIGGNGSGKTTLAKLLTGLYTPESGEIRLNGCPVTDKTKESYREHFSVVFSDFYLFEALLGLDREALDASARRYLGQLHLDHKVEVANGVLSTTDLSQGQRKRLALLTAFLEDRPIYLFDEWAADQDPLFKEVFYLGLLPELKARGKTVIVISHDDRYYYVADRIIKLEYGKIEYDRYIPRASRASTELSH